VVAYIRDNTGRFPRRPHYKPEELDYECEAIITAFVRDLYGAARFPVKTDDLTKLIERDTSDFDPYADLSDLGADVEGVTEFFPGRKPAVKIAADLSNAGNRENRLRTTMTHEYGHVHFHAYLWETEQPTLDLLNTKPHANKQICKRETILNAGQNDWMEWQAGYVCGAILMPVTHVRACVRPYLEARAFTAPFPSTMDMPALCSGFSLMLSRYRKRRRASVS
jgi:hypothetical protein